MSARVRSFDVFDTSITRLVGHPSSLFYLVGHCLKREGDWPGGVSQFVHARVEAESRARANATSQEVSLEAIYGELAFAWNLAAAWAERFMGVELRVEEELLRPVPQTAHRVAEHRRSGGRVLFVSDTYFPSARVQQWLAQHGLFAEGDRLFASSASGTTKATGDLFRHVLDEERIAASELVHRGDSIHADVNRPAALGIGTEWFSEGLLSPHEAAMEQHAAATAGAASLLAGASRWARLTVPAQTPLRQSLRGIAAQVAGPVLSAFVWWVLVRARSLGIRRLMFVARDGQVMMGMAEQLAGKLGMQFEMHYLYANRQVVNLAALRVFDANALDWLVGGAAVVSLADVLQRADLQVADIAAEVAASSVPLTGPVGWQNLPALRALLAQPAIAERVLASARRRRDVVRAYFRASGLMDGTPCAFVDIGWQGNVFKSICDVVGDEHASHHVALYFGLLGRPKIAPAGRQMAFLFDGGGAAPFGGGQDIPALVNVMEIFCQADHGQVISVAGNDGIFTPLLRERDNDVGPTWDVPYVQSCLLGYAQALALDVRWSDPMPDLRPLCRELLSRLMSRPTREEAVVLGSFRYTDGPYGGTAEAFAVPYRLSDFGKAFAKGSLPAKTYVWWEAGARAMSERGVLRILLAAARLSKFRSTPAWQQLRRLAGARGAK